MELYQRLEHILGELRPAFSREATFRWFVLLVWGILLNTQPPAVTSYVNAIGLSEGYYQQALQPILVPKHQRRLSGLDEKILALYARGTSTRDISAQLEELYGANVSASLISEVTDAVSEDVKAWQCRPLDEVYPIVYLDALYVNIKVSGRVSKRAVYVVLGVTVEGTKSLLGLWIGEAEAEGAKW